MNSRLIQMYAACALAVFFAATSARAAPIPYLSPNVTTITACVSAFTPMVYCEEGTDPADWSGYEIELFRDVMRVLEWPFDDPKFMKWRCMDWYDMLDGLYDGSCNISPSGITVNKEDMDAGVVFSWATYVNGLLIAVSADYAKTGYWAVFNAFTWQLWVAIGGTCLLVGLVVFAIDAMMAGVHYNSVSKEVQVGNHKDPNAEKKTLADYIWDAIMRSTQARDQRGLSCASNLVILLFAFMCMVLVIVYTANTTANLTTVRLQTSINGVQDLPGKKVGTWTGYKDFMIDYNVSPTLFEWDNVEDEDKMVNALKTGQIQALVMDESLLLNRASKDCDIATVGAKFEEFNQAIALSTQFNVENPKLLNAINEALVTLREDGTVQDLKSSLVDPPASECSNDGATASTSIPFSDVAGLWVLLAGSIVLALFMVVVHKLHVRYTKPKMVKLGSQVKDQVRQLQPYLSKKMSGGRIRNPPNIPTMSFDDEDDDGGGVGSGSDELDTRV